MTSPWRYDVEDMAVYATAYDQSNPDDADNVIARNVLAEDGSLLAAAPTLFAALEAAPEPPDYNAVGGNDSNWLIYSSRCRIWYKYVRTQALRAAKGEE